ncbi:HEAT repeat domain-containing protein [Streptomyces sp. NBC_01497]|uniref:HEAT repeat domain-containing protein n=1 Tax=Streptomyces sp. NBC_01497 TaxID=2903885 RepID=UPI002E35A4F9|nr:adenylosuccinate lyase [Streptomyces sp. NBC_01497]
MDVTDEDFRALADRVREESDAAPECEDLLGTEDAESLAATLVAPEQPLWAREIAAFRLGCARDRRAFETLVLLLNHRDPERCVAASYALTRLADPRTARAAAALATNPLRTAYALHPVRLLTALRAPESAPALIETLEGLLAPDAPHWRVALACVEGLGTLADPRAAPVLRAALGHPRLSAAAGGALSALAYRTSGTSTPATS